MKKLLALLLTLTLVSSCAFALAEASEASAPAGARITSTIDLNRETFLSLMGADQADAGTLATMNDVFNLLDNLSLEALAGPQGAYIALKLKDTELFNLEGAMDGENMLLTTSLLRNYAFSLNPAALTQSANLPVDIDVEKLLASFDFDKYEKLFTDAAAGWVKTPETGAFEIDGTVYDSKTPISVDGKTFKETMTTLVEYVKQDSMILVEAGLLPEPLDLGSALDDDEDENEENLEIEYYAQSETGNFLVTVVKGLEESSAFKLVYQDGRVNLSILHDEEGLEMSAGLYDAGVGMNIAIIDDNTVKVQLQMSLATDEQGAMVIYYAVGLGYDTLIAVTTTIVPTDEAYVPAIVTQDKTVVDMSDLTGMTEEDAQSLITRLQLDLMNYGLPEVLANLNTAMPEEAAVIMQLIQDSMAPAADTTAPATTAQ